MSDPALATEVRALIEHEARLLDDREYGAWLALYTQDARYWAPVSREQQRPTDGVAHFNDDLQLMMARTHRLANPRAFGAEPPPMTAHVVSGVRIEAADEAQVTATSSQLMLEWRQRGHFEADMRTFGGRVTHLLRRTPQGLRIAMKRVDLVGAEGSFNAMMAPI